MSENARFLIALSTFLMLLAGLEGLAGYAVFHSLERDEQQKLLEVLRPRAELILEIGLLALIVLGAAFAVAYRIYVKGPLKIAEGIPLKIAEGIRITLNANSSHRLESVGPPELKRLRQAVNDLAEHGEMLARDLEAKVAHAKSSVEEEKNRLAALMSELTEGVLVCNADGRILLYNERARQTLCAPENARNEISVALIGLGRFTIVDRSLLNHALERVHARLEKNEADSNAQFVFTTRTGQLIYHPNRTADPGAARAGLGLARTARTRFRAG